MKHFEWLPVSLITLLLNFVLPFTLSEDVWDLFSLTVFMSLGFSLIYFIAYRLECDRVALTINVSLGSNENPKHLSQLAVMHAVIFPSISLLIVLNYYFY